MIDARIEDVISLTAAAKSLPERRGGKRPHISCLYRWTTVGCKGVVLESIPIGGTRCTSREALARFFEALARQSELATFPPRTPTPAARSRSIANAECELAAAGI